MASWIAHDIGHEANDLGGSGRRIGCWRHGIASKITALALRRIHAEMAALVSTRCGSRAPWRTSMPPSLFAALMGDAELRRHHSNAAVDARELRLKAEFAIVELGQWLPSLCRQIDALDCRTLVYEALGTNMADRATPMIAEYNPPL